MNNKREIAYSAGQLLSSPLERNGVKIHVVYDDKIFNPKSNYYRVWKLALSPLTLLYLICYLASD